MRKNRDSLSIIADILIIVNEKPKKTQIMYRANLSFYLLQKYLSELTDASLISYQNGTQCYCLTLKGQEFIKGYTLYSKKNKIAEKINTELDLKRKYLQNLFNQ